jgi:UDP-glucose 4-epimerase
MANIKGSKILVTGGAGLVGSHIVDRLIKEGAGQIIVVDNFVRGSMDNLEWALKNGNVKVVRADISDVGRLDELMTGIDYVFHEAALRITQCAQMPREAFRTLFEGTFNVLEAASKFKVKKIIAASSASVYGEPSYLPIDEKHPFNNYTLYGSGKIATEFLLRSFFDMEKLDYIALRYFNIYGPRMDIFGVYTEVMIKWLDCIDEGVAPIIHGDGTASMDFVYIDDIVEANILALKSSATDNIFNIGTGQEVSLNELLSIILKVTGSNLKPQFQPVRKVNPVKRRRAEIKKAGAILRFFPKVSIEEGISRLVEWRKAVRAGK